MLLKLYGTDLAWMWTHHSFNFNFFSSEELTRAISAISRMVRPNLIFPTDLLCAALSAMNPEPLP